MSRCAVLGASITLALTACKQSEPASSSPSQPVVEDESEPTPKPAPEAGAQGLTDEERRRQDPDCQRILQTKCTKKYGPEYGEHEWGDISHINTSVFVDATLKLDCFRAYGETGTSDFIPPMGTKCHLGPKNQCVAVDSKAELDEPWEYLRYDWDKPSPWSHFKAFDEHLPHGTHVRIGWNNGNDDCEVWMEGYADLDGDEIYSTYISGQRDSDKATTKDVSEYEDPKKRDLGPEFGEDDFDKLVQTFQLFVLSMFIDECYRDFGETGSSDFIPPMSARCDLGPRNRCVPVDSQAAADEPWKYVRKDFSSKGPWSEFERNVEALPQSTHVRLNWSGADGKCKVWVEGFADLDGDGVYSTYLRSKDGYEESAVSEVRTPENPAKRGR